MQTSKEKTKTPETTESKGTQVAPKHSPADLGTDQKNRGNSNTDKTPQKPRPTTGKQEDQDELENEELEDENSTEMESDIDQAGNEKNSKDPSRTRTGMNDPGKTGL